MSKFTIAFVALNKDGVYFLPGGGPARMHDSVVVNDPSTLTMKELQQLIVDWGVERWSSDVTAKFITPMEDTDWTRTVEDWANNPTAFQVTEQVDDENKLFQKRRGACGKLAINFLVG